MTGKCYNLDRLSFGEDAGPQRALRSGYLVLRKIISEKRDDLVSSESEKFRVLLDRVEELHLKVKNPREQVADTKALSDMVNILVAYIMSHSNGGITPSDFLLCLLNNFSQFNGPFANEEGASVLNWKEIGLFVSPMFKRAHGCCAMNGPMNTEVKQRKVAVRNRRSKPSLTKGPEEIDDTEAEEKTDTHKNMGTMFDILSRKKWFRLEALILNRKSFAQTVENLFALSFLVKDGRVEITVDANGSHLASARNAPAANTMAYNHFVFRFDFKDWKLMVDMVDVGEELMPHRNPTNSMPASQTALATTLVRKLSRNHGLVVQEESFAKEYLENDEAGAGNATIRKCRRKLF